MKGIAKLASELGISTGTVSRALNGKSDVNAATRARLPLPPYGRPRQGWRRWSSVWLSSVPS